MKLFRLVPVLLVIPGAAYAQDDAVQYAPAPDWVVPMQPSAPPATAPDGPVFFAYSDYQVFANGQGTEQYTAYRVKLLRPEALALGNINLGWMPDAGGATVHHLRIIRDGQPIDVLEDTQFMVFQPQNGIEYAILSGQRLANVQAPGLRVGDEIEFAFTIRNRERALPDNSFGLAQVALMTPPGSFRLRVSWTDGHEPIWRTSQDFAGQIEHSENALEIRLDNPVALQFPDEGPPRYAYQRLLEFSDFESWQQLSARLDPLFSEAAALSPQSPVKPLAAKIMAEQPTALDRARTALQLVQDEVRYVYVGMNGANLIPATADKTWQRRYGDCKAKTVLLMALLAEMDIPARAVLVSSNGGDGINERLPNPQFFDHVMVQAQIDGAWYWLDGTRTGDLRMRAAPPDFYEWVLPLTAAGSDISSVPFVPLAEPEELNLVDVDARAGYDQPAKITYQRILRGIKALELRAALQSMSVADANNALGQSLDFDDIEQTSWEYDGANATMVIKATATDEIDWDEESGEERWQSSIIGAGFYPPDRRKRSAPQDTSAPWRNNPHRFTCHVTTMHLPEADDGWNWSHNADAMDQVIGGVAYWRMADLTGGTMRTVMASRALKYEISPQEAETANSRIADFDNAQSLIYQTDDENLRPMLEITDPSIKEVPTATGQDWKKDFAACIAPRLRDLDSPLPVIKVLRRTP